MADDETRVLYSDGVNFSDRPGYPNLEAIGILCEKGQMARSRDTEPTQ